MPYTARKSGGGYILTKPGSRKRAKGTGKRFRSKRAAYAQAAAIRHSEARRRRRGG